MILHAGNGRLLYPMAYYLLAHLSLLLDVTTPHAQMQYVHVITNVVRQLGIFHAVATS